MSAPPHFADQSGFAYRFDWGPEGLAALAPACDVIVVVDVLRFTSAVSAAVEAGAEVLPFVWRDERAAAFAEDRGAVLAGRRELGEPSLSPTDLRSLPAGTRLVLPSPNGSTIAFEAIAHGVPFVLAGCLRNATATARRALALAHGGAVGVIAAGERREDGSLRPAVEDLIGAGAVLHGLDPAGSIGVPGCSPEASAARAAYLDARPLVGQVLDACASGRQLHGFGFGDDVATAAEIDTTDLAAQLTEGAFVGV